MKNGKCPKCGCERILANLSLSGRGNRESALGIFMTVMKSPDAWIFKDAVESPLRAWVCEACGFTEFYAVMPSLLGQAIDAAQPTDAFKQRELPFRMKPDAD